MNYKSYKNNVKKLTKDAFCSQWTDEQQTHKLIPPQIINQCCKIIFVISEQRKIA